MTAPMIDRTPAPQATVIPWRRQGGAEALLAAATTEVLVMSTRAVASREPIGVLRQVDQENVRRGVRYRVITPDAARTAPGLGTHLAAITLAGADTRTVPEVPSDALVIDRSTVLVPASPGGSGATALRLPSVVAMTVELFERVWAGAVPLSGSEVPADGEIGDREKELLALLSLGYTDAAAAAKLGLSVRTVRRVVADIMNRLGARSRFQAGAKAADRGWLMDRAG